MLPTLGGDSKGSVSKPPAGSKGSLDPQGSSFLSRMLGRSPSKGAAAGATTSPRPDSVLASPGAAPPTGSSLKGAPPGSSSTNTNNWSIGSGKTDPAIARTPSKGSLKTTQSARSLEDAAAAAAAAKSPYMDKVNTLLSNSSSSSSNSASSLGSLGARPPSAARLAPLPAGPVGSTTSSASTAAPPVTSSAVQVVAAPRASAAEEDAMRGMSTEELMRMAMALHKEKKALQQQVVEKKALQQQVVQLDSGSGTSALQHPSAARSSKVAFNPAANTVHRSASLVVEFAEPRHQQRPSMIAQNLEQIRAGLAPAASSKPRESVVGPGCEFGATTMEVDGEEDGFMEEDEAPPAVTQAKRPQAAGALIGSGPSLDPIQGTKAAAAAKQQMMSEAAAAAAEAEAEAARREADTRKQAEAASQGGPATAAEATAAAKRRYKLLSVFPLLPPAMRREEWSLSQFAVEKRLHKGYASEVYKAKDLQSGELLAVKVYNLQALGELNKVQLIREIRLHGAFAHRNIIELFVAFQEEHRVILAQKYAEGGDLLKALHHAGDRLTEHSAVSMVIQPLLACLTYLHGKGIIHRDIKPENILFEHGILKLADFGLALNSHEEHAVTRAGTLHYMAPEVVKNPLKDHPDDFKNENRYHYNVVVDSWAVGCLAYELLAGYPPFTATTQQQVVHNINTMELRFTKRMSEDAISFISAALERKPCDRATTSELIRHPWITQHTRRSSARNLALQPQAGNVREVTDFAGAAKAKAANTRREADHGPIRKEACMAPF